MSKFDDLHAAEKAIEARWATIMSSDAISKDPQIVQLYSSWLVFLTQWKNQAGIAVPDDLAFKLHSEGANEWRAEQAAAKLGFNPNTAPVNVPTPGSSVLSRTQTFDPDSKHPERPVSDTWGGAAAPVVEPIVKKTEEKDPYLAAKIGGLAAIALGTLSGSLAAKSDATRVGIAVGGSLLAASVAWLSFAPDHGKSLEVAAKRVADIAKPKEKTT